ncbi:hypothetical protein H0H87_004510 [Tephrocybe sp. NHM501043]|nr:hypothetical protein H0H87_004510 [Tephrocybe sp. NHM501043]
MNFRAFFDHKHRNFFFISLTWILSFLALRPTPSAVPIVLTLSTLQVYALQIFPSQHSWRDTTLLTITVAFAGALARTSPSLNALSTTGVSIVVLSVLALITSFMTIIIIYLNTRLSGCFKGTWSQITLFPALWATLWYGVSFMSPVGRLSAWSPADSGLGGFYGWMVPYFGPAGSDWVVAAWAVVLSRGIGAWFIGEDEEPPLTAQAAPTAKQTSRLSEKSSSLLLLALLAILAVPSLLLSNFPLAVVAGPQITPLSVGCVLPPYRRYHHHTLTLNDYIEESKKLTSAARFLLWPEGAVTFNSELELAEGLSKVRQIVTGSVVGVSFEENFGDPDSGTPGSRRTGIALVSQSSDSPELIYYKRHLVPIAESFSLSHSLVPPNITTIQLTAPKGWNKTAWVPEGPPYTRAIPVTASICLDFAHPAQFAELESRPALIFAPARTWDIAVGNAMWEQAKQRAEELGSMVLWCDGGDGGVSGVAGGGYDKFAQVGLGSWAKTVGIAYPFDERQTIFARVGNLTLLLIWLLVLGSTVLDHVHFGSTSTSKRFLQSRFARRPRGPTSSSASTPNTPASSTWKHKKPAVATSGDDWLDDFVLITQKDLPIRLDNAKPGPDLAFGAYSSQFPSPSAQGSPSNVPAHSQRIQLADLCLDFPQPPTFIPSPRETTSQEPSSPLKSLTRLIRSSLPNSTNRSPTLIAKFFKARAHSSTSRLPNDGPSPPQYSEAPTPYLYGSHTTFTLPQHHLASPYTDLPASSLDSILSPLELSTRHPTLRPKPSFGTSFISQSTISRNPSTSGHTLPFPSTSQVDHHSQTHSNLSFIIDNTQPSHQHQSINLTSHNISSNHNERDTPTMFAHGESPPLRDLADYGGKRTDVVDFGSGIDYSGHQWFQDKPVRPPPPPPQPEYTPAPEVILENDNYEYALSSAPNVLYARYKQYGQLGVLAWCSEFSELIDSLKDLGFQGNMFTTTRAQALETCTNLLKVPMDIEMQLIIMYLSSQVSRLRHFLDSEAVWDDYPIPKFPVHPPQVSISPGH